MKTVADANVHESLVARLQALTASRERRWGSLTAHEMLCHLGDATDMALGVRPRPRPVPVRRRPIMKSVWLWSPIRFPHGVRTNPHHNPKADGTRPSDFQRDLARAMDGIRAIAAASDGLESAHGLFGTMSTRDWQRWAYKHTDHHLRQFGL